MLYAFLFIFFSLPLTFTLHWWPLAFLILSPPLQNCHVVLPRKKFLLCFLSLALDICRPLSHWASLACRLLSLFLCLSLALYSKFVDITIYLSLILIRQHGYRNNFRLPFSSLLTLLLCLLYKTPVAMRFPAKITSSCIWVAIPVDWVILHWYACGADERPGDRSVYGHMITKFSRMGSLPHFLTHGAPLHALRTRELCYKFITMKPHFIHDWEVSSL